MIQSPDCRKLILAKINELIKKDVATCSIQVEFAGGALRCGEYVTLRKVGNVSQKVSLFHSSDFCCPHLLKMANEPLCDLLFFWTYNWGFAFLHGVWTPLFASLLIFMGFASYSLACIFLLLRVVVLALSKLLLKDHYAKTTIRFGSISIHNFICSN